MAVKFLVECKETTPGDAVFIAGSGEQLGNFSPANALPMITTAEAFPMWSTSLIELPAGEEISFKFIIQKEDGTGGSKWEILQEGNRTVTPAEGKLVTVSATWSKSGGETKSMPLPTSHRNVAKGAKSSDELLQERSDNERTVIAMAEYTAEDAYEKAKEGSEIAPKLMAREPMRRNFSQSLFDAVEEDEDVTAEGDAPNADQAGEVTPSMRGISKQISPPGINLKHIASFTALSALMAEDEKDKARQTGYQPQYDAHNLDVPVVVVTSEFAPYSKTGGLGLVAASYSYEFPRRGHRTMVVSPKYKHYDGINYVGEARVVVGGNEEMVKFWHKNTQSPGNSNGCDAIFVEHPSLERSGGLYSGDDGREYHDNLKRFTLLSLAAMEAPLILTLNGSRYGDKVIFLANDWQAGLVPMYMNYKYRANNTYRNARTIYVVHNMGYQGSYPGVNACSFFAVNDKAAASLAVGNTVNLSKGAMVNADRVLTVSPNYANEIQTVGGGFGLQDFVRAKAHAMRLAGILNGIDDTWNPAIDTHITKQFTVETLYDGKAANKRVLQERLGLEQNPRCVLIGFVGRLSWQKGVDILGSIIPWLMEDTGNGVTGHAQLVMMGNGEKQYAEVLANSENRYRGRVCGYVGFDPTVEHEIMAGCDLFLMPSRYEPCGLPQMICQQYGTLPLVTQTGGLLDSVKDISSGCEVATGFYIFPLESAKLKEVVYRACDLYLHRRDDFYQMQINAMQTDFYWPKAMDEYERHIDYTLNDPPASYV